MAKARIDMEGIVARVAAASESADEIGMVVLDVGTQGDELYFKTTQQGKKLGIDLTRLPGLYKAAHNMFKENRMLETCTRVVLLLNADYETVWNVRKTMLDENKDWKSELKLVDLVLTKHFKSAPTWTHRLWVLNKLLEQTDDRIDILDHELKVCTKVAEAYRRCYNAWCYRVNLCSLLSTSQLDSERHSLREWFKKHVSDYSSMNYMKCILTRIRKPQVICDEIAYCNHLVVNYPGHQALWQYKRDLFYILVNGHTSSITLGGLPFEVPSVDAAQHIIDECAQKHQSSDSLSETIDRDIQLSLSCAVENTCSRHAIQQQSALAYIVYVCRVLIRHKSGIPAQKLTRMPFACPGPCNPADLSPWMEYAAESLRQLATSGMDS
mmetsp:Transcript_3633/g.6957  ORF Transcript_3633/g.6957 Transcript_3633/m.6957 type:complete len:382 (-) Transcript_3633:923-2068(-)